MAVDVKVYYMSGGKQWERTYPKIDRVTEGEHALRLEAKRYPNLSGPSTDNYMKHVISIPYTAMAAWQEEDV